MLKNLINVVVDRTVTRILIDVQPIAEVVYDRLVDRYGHYNLLNELAERIDVSTVAEHVDHEEVASYLNPDSIAAAIDTDAITEAIAESIDTSEIAAEVAEQVDWADHVPSAAAVAGAIDLDALAAALAERTGSTAAAEVAPSAGLIDRMLDRAVDRLLAMAEEAATRGDL